MELNLICDKIISDAKIEAEKIKMEANVKAKAILDSAVEKYTNNSNEYKEKSKSTAKDVYDRIISTSTLNAQKDILASKRELINKAFLEVLEKLSNLSLDEYKTLIKEKTKEINGKAQICISQKYFNDITEEFIKEINSNFSKSDKTVKSGFAIKQETCEINYDFTEIIERMTSQYDTQVANILFS